MFDYTPEETKIVMRKLQLLFSSGVKISGPRTCFKSVVQTQTNKKGKKYKWNH